MYKLALIFGAANCNKATLMAKEQPEFVVQGGPNPVGPNPVGPIADADLPPVPTL
jgi:hypothetical protein